MLFVFGHVTGQNIVMAWMIWSLSAQIIKRLKRQFKKNQLFISNFIIIWTWNTALISILFQIFGHWKISRYLS